jgi:hypothetical protein
MNKKYNLNLNNDLDKYEMYTAKKNGKKNKDLPALSKKQIINQIGINRFVLDYVNE